jgi:tetratricopeptide (TPR) repeat protein
VTADDFYDLGHDHYLRRSWAEAEKYLRQALALKPDHRRAHNSLGMVLAHAGRGDEALAEFRRGGCSRAGCHANLADVLVAERRFPEALEQYQLALAADPSSAVAQNGLEKVQALLAESARTEPALASPDNPSGPKKVWLPPPSDPRLRASWITIAPRQTGLEE